LNITGYGVLEVAPGGPKLCEAGVVRGRTRHSLAARVLEIHTGLSEVIAALKPAVMALEELYSHYARPRTSILMGHARGVICLAAAEAEIKVVHYSATRIKKILTGNGRAPKIQMQQAVQRELRLAAMPEPPDVADALAVALCHYYMQPEWSRLARQRPA
jgi:crossover junction endodeoxyribonuclease RuvC